MELAKSMYSGKEIDGTNATYIEGYGLIADDEVQDALMAGEIRQCYSCGELIGGDVAMTGPDDEYYCRDCFDEDFFVCEHCGRAEYRDDAREVHYGSSRYNLTEYWCENCADIYATQCDDCGELFYDDLTRVHGGDCVCDSCLENDYRYCEDCGEYYLEDDGEWDDEDGSWYCNNCRDKQLRIIHGYHSYRADLEFRGNANRHNTLHMGVELEIDRGGESNENATAIADAAGWTPNKDVVFMHDGSLNNGFETISQPATLEYHTNSYNWGAMMKKALHLGYRSHDTGTCGMHVHVDREYFRDSFVSEDYAFALLVVNNREWLKRFSRRRHYHYCPFPEFNKDIDYTIPFTAEDFSLDKCKKNSKRSARVRLDDLVTDRLCSHYSCVNTSNRATVEFRFFRGTLNFTTFIANLQLVEMMCYAVKKFRYEQMCGLNFHWFMRLAKRRGYKEFIAYANKRMRGYEDSDI